MVGKYFRKAACFLSIGFCFLAETGKSTEIKPIASFKYKPVNGFEIKFIDYSVITPGEIVSREWKFSDGTSSFEKNPLHVFSQQGSYHIELIVVASNGKKDTISDMIHCYNTKNKIFSLSSDTGSRNISALKVPNAFTPNGDGLNDTWQLDCLNKYPEAVVDIFDRWGTHLFHGEGFENSWNGRYQDKEMPLGAYLYVIDLKNGTQPVTGTVSIVR